MLQQAFGKLLSSYLDAIYTYRIEPVFQMKTLLIK